MIIEIPFTVWSALLLAAVVAGVIIQYRILRILKQMNNGEPTTSDMQKIEFGKIKFKE